MTGMSDFEAYETSAVIRQIDHALQTDEQGFRLIGLSEIRQELTGAQWLVKPFIERVALTVMFGESGTLKTFVALDLALSIAFGVDFHGHPTHQAPTVYVCGEGAGGIGRRVEAWLIDRQLTDQSAPFFVSSVPAELMSIGNTEELADVIETQCEQPGLVVVDTLSTNIGQGDESANPDVATTFKNLNLAIRDRFGAATLVVHHVGHGAKDRERGASAIRSNADGSIMIKREPDGCSMHSKKTKDAPPFEPVAFESKVITIPDLYDSEGEPATSLVLRMTEYVEAADDGSLTRRQRQAIATLETMYADARKNLESAGRDPSKALIDLKGWLDRLQDQEIIGPSRSLRTRIKNELSALKRIRVDGAHVHLIEVSDND